MPKKSSFSSNIQTNYLTGAFGFHDGQPPGGVSQWLRKGTGLRLYATARAPTLLSCHSLSLAMSTSLGEKECLPHPPRASPWVTMLL